MVLQQWKRLDFVARKISLRKTVVVAMAQENGGGVVYLVQRIYLQKQTGPLNPVSALTVS